MKKAYTIHMGSPPPVIMADSPEEALIVLREDYRKNGIYLPVPFTIMVTADDFEGDVTA